MASGVRSLTDKLKKSDDTSGSISIAAVIKAVQALPDLNEDLILDACNFLENEKNSEIFLALDAKLRRKWLIRKLSSAGRLKESDDTSGSISIGSVIKAVRALPVMNEDLILDACDFLENEKNSEIFIALADAKLRRKWLKRKLPPQI